MSGAKVSVVVPVYNPGPFIEPCIDSLLSQTMPPGDLEVVFVDDGSTDDTLGRLTELAAAHGHMRVISIPNSGWPGKPRNVGVEHATGDYVMFVDQDDALEPEALERMHAVAVMGDTDVVLGKVVSDFRGVNAGVYRMTRPVCTVWDAPLMDSLTPHKMIRAQFLRASGVKYPEGPRRLEDQLYMAKVYFAARRASIVGDYVCYRYQSREDGKNAGNRRIHPPEYFANLREVLDVVDSAVPPGPVRDQFYRRFLRVEMLGRLGGVKLRRLGAQDLPELFAVIRKLMVERFPETVDEGLPVALRLRAAAVRRDDEQWLRRQGEAMDSVKVQAQLHSSSWAAGRVMLDLEVRVSVAGSELLIEDDDGRLYLPRSLAGDEASEEDRRILLPADAERADVVVQHRSRLDDWFVEPVLARELERVQDGCRMRWRGQPVLDPATAAGGQPLRAGKHDLYAKVNVLGLQRSTRLRAPSEDRLGASTVVFTSSGRADRLYVTDNGNVSVDAGTAPATVKRALSDLELHESDGRELAVRFVHGPPPAGAVLRLDRADGRAVAWPLELRPAGEWAARRPDGGRVRAGAYAATLVLPGPVRIPFAERVVVAPTGRLSLHAAGRLTHGADRLAKARRVTAALRQRAARWAAYARQSS